jgi:uncharacterized protein
LLDAIEPPLQPLAIDALDGFLAGVVGSGTAGEDEWLPLIADADRRPCHLTSMAGDCTRCTPPRQPTNRPWRGSDGSPWVLEPDNGAASASDAVLAWIAGFATALEHFPDLAARNDAGS